jgi:hypothetical protein
MFPRSRRTYLVSLLSLIWVVLGAITYLSNIVQ